MARNRKKWKSRNRQPGVPPIPDGFTRMADFAYSGDGQTVEEMMRGAFDKLMVEIVKEMERQVKLNVGRPFRAHALITVETGHIIKIEITGLPPMIDDLLRVKEDGGRGQ